MLRYENYIHSPPKAQCLNQKKSPALRGAHVNIVLVPGIRHPAPNLFRFYKQEMNFKGIHAS